MVEELFSQPLVQEPAAHETFAPVPPEIFTPKAEVVAQDAAPEDDSSGSPQESREAAPFAELDGIFLEPEPEDFLAQARRSAQAALERAERERIVRLSSFHSGPTEAAGEDRSRPRYLIPLLAASLVAIVATTAFVMSQRAKTLGAELAAANSVTARSPELAALPRNPQSVVAPASEADAENDQTAEIKRATGAAGIGQPAPADGVTSAPDKRVAIAAKTPATGDRVVQLANAGNPVALAILGLRALDGAGGTSVNLPEAVQFLSQAANKGQAVAQYRLGTLYERGQGVAPDPAKAMHWYELAANQGNRKAMHNLAVAYAGGAKRNMTEAARWFAKAATLGLADSQFNLAVLYERGEGVPQSLTDAYKWYAVAALSGDAEAKARMGVLETQLNESDRTTANKSAAGFRATPLIRSVNVPPEPADLGTPTPG